MTDEDLDRFEAWLLEDERLARTSASKIRRDVATMDAHGPEPQLSERLADRLRDYRWAWGFWDRWCALEMRPNRLLEPPEPERQPRRRRGPKRLREAVSIPEEPWNALLRGIEHDTTLEGRILDLMASTALRISDVLRCSRATIDAGFARPDGITTITVKGSKDVTVSVRGGAEREWALLRDALPKRHQLVCEALAPGSDWTGSSTAYKRCLRHLRKLAEQAGVPGRIHLHRVRRTVAVRALASGLSMERVGKILHHEPGSRATARYVDEAMAEQVSADLGTLRKRG